MEKIGTVIAKDLTQMAEEIDAVNPGTISHVSGRWVVDKTRLEGYYRSVVRIQGNSWLVEKMVLVMGADAKIKCFLDVGKTQMMSSEYGKISPVLENVRYVYVAMASAMKEVLKSMKCSL